LVFALAAGAGVAGASRSAGELPAKTWEVIEVADGVWGFVWREPLRDPIEGNALFIVNQHDVVVVDTGLFPSSARLMAAELRKLTDAPVRYVVNTHWHDDHHGGNQVYRELWPEAEIVAHPYTREDALELSHRPRPGILAGYGEQAETYRRWLERGSDDDGKALDAARRERVEQVIALLELAREELGGIEATLPDLVVEDRLVLHRRSGGELGGERTIEIRWPGLGNTRGDLIVLLPRERLVAIGDLVVYPIPFGIGSHYREWAGTLEALAALEVDVLFPGHGPPLRDRSYLREVRDLLRDLVGQVDVAVAEGLTLDQTREKVTLGEWKTRLAHGDAELERAFDAFFVGPAVQRAWELAKGVAPAAEGLRRD
jgi:cyclase